MTETETKEIELSLNEKLQLFLMDFEAALFQRCKCCGHLVKKNWSPREWGDKLEQFIKDNEQY